jgi:ATP-dependent DNA helicase RecG
MIKKSAADQEALAWLLKPLKLELKQGCRNTAVAGGLEKWLPRLREKLTSQAGLSPAEADRLLQFLDGYEAASPEERREKIQGVSKAFQAGNGQPVPVSTKSRPPQASTAVSAPAAPPAVETKPGDNRPVQLEDPVQYLKGVGPQRARMLEKLGITTVGDLLRHYPRDWQDRSQMARIGEVKAGETALISGVVRGKSVFRPRRGLTLAKVILDDGTGRIQLTWFNQAYMADRFIAGQRVLAHGKVEFFRGWQMASPEIEILEEEAESPLLPEMEAMPSKTHSTETEDAIHTNRIVPIYPLTENLSQRVLRGLIYRVLQHLPRIPEILPPEVVTSRFFPEAGEALAAIHFPKTADQRERSRGRLVFEELFLQQVAVVRWKQRFAAETGYALNADGPLHQGFLRSLPFQLTEAQEEAWRQIAGDIATFKPMHRLLQGDVGSGKTVVAGLALLSAVDSGLQAALMAPTEVLAAQHFLTLKKLFEPLAIRVELFSSSVKTSERRQLQEDLEAGRIQVAVGTHALTQEKVIFQKLGLAVIDEQHRFGVEQRAQLRAKGKQPHVLVMTATPIPRTLALTVYGDLDVTTVSGMPPGRMPVVTEWLAKRSAGKAYKAVTESVGAGRQAYIIFPLIDESEKSDLKALTTEFVRLSKHVFPQHRIGLLHGRLANAEKEQVMADFKAGVLDILTATTVVEVGVDVPNATVMVIEDADRFGLAQLHQLRGRVGRGRHAAQCFLIADPKTEDGKARMSIMTKIRDGFKLSEEDLALRGPGEFFGLRQHGLPDLKLADLVQDAAEIEHAREAAQQVIAQDPALARPDHAELLKMLDHKYGQDPAGLTG